MHTKELLLCQSAFYSSATASQREISLRQPKLAMAIVLKFLCASHIPFPFPEGLMDFFFNLPV